MTTILKYPSQVVVGDTWTANGVTICAQREPEPATELWGSPRFRIWVRALDSEMKDKEDYMTYGPSAIIAIQVSATA